MWTTLWEQGCPPLQWGVVIGASLVGAVTDLSARRIPNRLTGPVLLTGLVWSAYAGGLAGLCEAIVAGVMLAIPYLLLLVLAGGGAGDAKLMGAMGAWLGIVNGLVVLVTVSIGAILLAAGLAAARKRVRPVLSYVLTFVNGLVLAALSRGRLKDRKVLLPVSASVQTMPYGVAIFVGACLAGAGVLLWRA